MGNHFRFDYEWLEVVKNIIITEHVIDGKKTIVKLSNGNVGIAKCSPDDDFDEYEGLRIATARAYGKEPFPKEVEENPDGVREVIRKANVGEYIKIVKPFMSFGHYKKGDIFEVKKNKYCGEIVCTSTGNDALVYEIEYVVLGNYKPKAEEKKNPKNEPFKVG